ncbi:glycosyltransferase family 1 protein [Evansella halocellulosilytica]|uniref:glycosyltransferase family 1 protein n=1 Tax=Evansella halocellulosilytica TaxID=2011013 RepID=UPI000BB942D0|nr:glycosyltransferase family 1 protein [Evansella halocellulosilytica]
MKEPVKRVLHVFGRLDSGGAESRTMDIYRSIDRSKIQFDFAIHTKDECFFSDEVRSLGGKIFNFPRFTGKNYFKYKKAWRSFFKKHPEYDIIHGHQTSTGFIYLNEALKNDVKVRIAHARNSNKDSRIKRFTTKLARYYASDLFAVSRLAGISEFGKKLVADGTVKVIPNAIDVEKYKFDEGVRNRVRKDLLLEDELAVIHIGRFHPQKNHNFLIDVFNVLLEKDKNAKLFLVGDGGLRNNIEEKIKELKLENKVEILGIRSDVPELLQGMDLLLFPSFFEGLPGVVLEAQAAGLPCIISNSITNEVLVTNRVYKLDLGWGAHTWAEKVTDMDFFHDKRIQNRLVNKKFGIHNIKNFYETFYTKV